MRLFARAHLVRSPAAVSRMTVMRPLLQRNYYWGIVDEFKKNLQEDAELNALKEELKRVSHAEGEKKKKEKRRKRSDHTPRRSCSPAHRACRASAGDG